MKKLLTGALVFSFALGLLAGGVLTLPERASAARLPQCVLEPEPFYWVDMLDPEDLCDSLDVLYDNPGDTTQEWFPAYQCEGYWSTTGKPCQCTFIGCCQIERPTGKTPIHE